MLYNLLTLMPTPAILVTEQIVPTFLQSLRALFMVFSVAILVVVVTPQSWAHRFNLAGAPF